MASSVSLTQRRGNWAQIYDESSQDHYYYNSESGAVTWDVPADWESYRGEGDPSSPLHRAEDPRGFGGGPAATTGDDEISKEDGAAVVVDLLTGDDPLPDLGVNGESVPSRNEDSIVRGASASVSLDFGMSAKSATIVAQSNNFASPMPEESNSFEDGSNPFGDDSIKGGDAPPNVEGGNPFDDDIFEIAPKSAPLKPSKPPKPPKKPIKSPKIANKGPSATDESGNPFGDDDEMTNDHSDDTTVSITNESTEMTGERRDKDWFTVNKKGPKPSDFLGKSDEPLPPPPKRNSTMNRESQMDEKFRLSFELVQSGYLEDMEKMGYPHYLAQVELLDAAKKLQKEEKERNEGNESSSSSIFGKKKILTAKQVAVASLCSQLKQKPLYYDKKLWTQTIFTRVGSWLPDVEDPETGEFHTYFIVSVTVRYTSTNSMTWKLNRRMRHFQNMWNRISSSVSSALSPASMKHQFPSTLGGWFKGNADKDKNKRMTDLTSFLEELCSTSILVADHDIYETVEEFLEIDKHVAEKMGKQLRQAAAASAVKRPSKPRPSNITRASVGVSSEGNPFG